MSSRKRAAPGADPPIQLADNATNFQPVIDYSYDTQPADWLRADNMNAGFGASNGYNIQQPYNTGPYDNFDPSVPYMDTSQLGVGGVIGEPGQLVRRNPNQQLATRGLQWQDDTGGQGIGNPDSEDEAELNQRAIAAKTEAQARNRQIPPFIQKLSSFLDESKNTDLIRWSDDGRSFVVLDEEEFAKTLIPELFKHNNYASFVRQLNMYGFHKKVGLSDNSMKASENKRKTPSEYWNQYFRRGRPDLLYLIQKPKTVPTSKRKREDGRGEHSDEEKKPSLMQIGNNATIAGAQPNQDLATIPKQELVGLRNELLTLQRQQKLISGVIGQIKRQNDQLYQQATAFQAMHDRHESSINAILTFLATFYNRSLEGNGPMNMAEMFKNALGGQANQQPQGNIVEMPDLPHMDINSDIRNGTAVTPIRRKQPLLLPAPDAKPASTSSTPAPPASSRTAHPRTQTATPQPRRPPAPRVSSIEDSGGFVEVPSPLIKAESETPQTVGDTSDILSAINAANANSPASVNNLDFSSALEQLQNADGASSLTPQQRKQMLSILGADSDASGELLQKANTPAGIASSLPQQITQSNNQLEILERLQKEQDAKVAQLAERLGPLSPNGAIPGLADAQNNGTPIPPPDFNFDDYLNDNTAGSNFDFDQSIMQADPNYDDLGIGLQGDSSNHFTLGGAGDDEIAYMEKGGYFGSSSANRDDGHLDPHKRVESLTSRETTPGSAANAGDDQTQRSGNSPRKRRKTGEL